MGKAHFLKRQEVAPEDPKGIQMPEYQQGLHQELPEHLAVSVGFIKATNTKFQFFFFFPPKQACLQKHKNSKQINP